MSEAQSDVRTPFLGRAGAAFVSAAITGVASVLVLAVYTAPEKSEQRITDASEERHAQQQREIDDLRAEHQRQFDRLAEQIADLRTVTGGEAISIERLDGRINELAAREHERHQRVLADIENLRITVRRTIDEAHSE